MRDQCERSMLKRRNEDHFCFQKRPKDMKEEFIDQEEGKTKSAGGWMRLIIFKKERGQKLKEQNTVEKEVLE